MTQTRISFDVRSKLQEIVTEVFSTMVAIAVKPADVAFPSRCDRVSGSVGIAGENLSGTLSLHVPAELAAKAATGMLGMELTPDAPEVNDVIGELTNMVGGGFKSALNDANVFCAMSVPSLVRGRSFVVETVPGAENECVCFECNGSILAVELNIKFE